jgi:N-methylhydantoinase B
VRLVEGGILRQDLQEDFLVRGRTREANALDLRAQIASNLALERRFREMVERYGIDAVTGVLARTIEYTAATVRERLREVPDGRWTAETFLDYDDRGDLSLYRCRLELTKASGGLTLDFTDASPQAPAVVNCSRGGLEIAVLNAMLSLVGWDLPKCPAGVMQTYTVVSEPGRFIHASWPAGVTKATTSAMQCVREAVTLAVGRMFACSETLSRRIIAPCAGFSGLPDITGTDQRGQAFSAPLLDFSLSSGYGARSFRDGIHTGGVMGSPGASMANVEVYEQRYPLLYLTRREEIDTAGPGRFEGGSALCLMLTPHDTERIPDVIFHAHGVHVPSTLGLHGGLPGSTNQFVVKRQTDIWALLERGGVPTGIEDVQGPLEVFPGICRSHLDRGDVGFWINNGGGGYGDPLDRGLDLVERDLRLGYLSAAQAAVYGAVVGDACAVDREATRASQARIRRERLARATPPPSLPDAPSGWHMGGGHGCPVTDRLALAEAPGGLVYACRCGTVLGRANRDHRDYLPRFDAPCTSAGPRSLNLIEEPRVALRHYVCPGCGALVDVDLVERARDEAV